MENRYWWWYRSIKISFNFNFKWKKIKSFNRTITITIITSAATTATTTDTIITSLSKHYHNENCLRQIKKVIKKQNAINCKLSIFYSEVIKSKEKIFLHLNSDLGSLNYLSLIFSNAYKNFTNMFSV